MLVLTRKQGETIRVADDVTIKVIRTAKGTVKIGIEAPPSVKVLRGELSEKIEQAAATTIPEPTERPTAVELVGYFPYPQTA